MSHIRFERLWRPLVAPSQHSDTGESQDPKASVWATILVCVVLAVHVPFLRGGYETDDFIHLTRFGHDKSFQEVVTELDAFGFFRPG